MEKWFIGTGWIGKGKVEDGNVVCRLNNYPYGESEKHAKLIVAAPDLLAACELVEEAWSIGVDSDMATAVDAVLLAIYKAKR